MLALPRPLWLAALAACLVPTLGATAPRSGTRTADTTPPQVTSLSLPKSLSMTPFGATLPFGLAANDQGSGMQSLSAEVLGPSGQTITLYTPPMWGQTRVEEQQGIYLPPTIEPGAWVLQSIMACDRDRNCTVIDGGSLPAIGGRHRMTVKNPFYDRSAPTLASGLLGVIPGSDNYPPSATARLVILDTGEIGLAGIYSASVQLCTVERGGCVRLNAFTGAPGQASATLVAGANPDLSLPSGRYYIQSVTLTDHLSNSRELTNVLFGGDTDFAPLFGQTWLDLP
jgi:hypothetical protein